ncbi:MAG TPA: response regulator [Gemmatimonadaceae bacterium]|nr:response regulator [Gemmatimonadaceae bacterium]
MDESESGTARVLVVGESQEIAGAIARALEASGCAVVHISERRATVAAAEQHDANAIVIEGRAADVGLLEVCRALRDDPSCSVTPIIVATPAKPRRDDVLAALAAGAWHVCGAPVDIEELRIRIANYAAARERRVHGNGSSLVDQETGLYNAAGLARRGRELGSEAMRQRTELAFIALSADAGADLPSSAIARCGQMLRTVGRLSDIVGRLGPAHFLIVAPATGSAGAARLARRFATGFRTALAQALPPDAHVRVRAGYTALPNLAYSPVEPTDILARATVALRGGELSADFEWLSPSEVQGLGPPRS